MTKKLQEYFTIRRELQQKAIEIKRLQMKIEELNTQLQEAVKGKDAAEKEIESERKKYLELESKYNKLLEDLKTDVVRKGWLQKRGGVVKNWKQRYCILSNAGEFKYYDKMLPDPRGTIRLKSIAKVNETVDEKKRKNEIFIWIVYL